LVINWRWGSYVDINIEVNRRRVQKYDFGEEVFGTRSDDDEVCGHKREAEMMSFINVSIYIPRQGLAPSSGIQGRQQYWAV
jgi:hypothetical protein